MERSAESDEVASLTRELLLADRRASHTTFGMQLAASSTSELVDVFSEERLVGCRVGPFRIDAMLGRGGMGAVFRAHRDDGEYEGHVAIKFMGEGGTEHRFQLEKHALGRLAHPGISRIQDAGRHPELGPYLVMDLVDGLPIDSYCRTHQLSAAQILRLMIDVLDAVGHAHGQFVLHRDLKPSNILVRPDARPVILDFGVAKFLLGEAAPRGNTQGPEGFTPRYAAPEQWAHEPLGIPTDLFAIGVIVYELISGAHPFLGSSETASGRALLMLRVLDGDQIPLRRALAERGPARARMDLGNAAVRDLETVLLTALARDPLDAFPSASSMAEELRRIVEDRPIRLRHPSALARLARLVRRQWLASAALLLATLSLLLGAGLSYRFAREAQAQRDAALSSAARAESIAALLVDAFGAADPRRSQGEVLTAKHVLDTGSARIQQDAAMRREPALAAALESVIAETYRSIGALDEADALYQRALDRIATQDAGAVRGPILSGRGWLRAFQGRWEDSIADLENAIALLEANDDRQALATAWCRLATPLLNTDAAARARTSARRGLELLALVPDASARGLLGCQSAIATSLVYEGRLEEAESAYLAILDIRLRDASQLDGLASAHLNLAAIRARLGKFDAAVDSYLQALTEFQQRFGSEHHEVAGARLGLGMAYRGSGNLAGARSELQQAVEGYSRVFGDAHGTTAYARMLAAEFLLLDGEPALADAVLGRAADVIATSNGAQSTSACRARMIEHGIAALQQRTGASDHDFGADLACLGAKGAPPLASALARVVAFWRARESTSDDAGEKHHLAARAVDALPFSDTLLTRAVRGDTARR